GPPPSGEAWQELAAEVGVPCPPELSALGDVQAARRIWAGSWEVLEPASVASERKLIRDFAGHAPCLLPLTRWLPLFTSDGDLLLLDHDGAVRRRSVDYGTPYHDYGTVATSLADMLDAFLRRECRPLLWSWDDEERGDPEEERTRDGSKDRDLGWWWVDE